MIKKMIVALAVSLGLTSSIQNHCWAQQTKEEREAAIQAMKSELKSKDAQERAEKIAKLELPADCTVNTIDEVKNNSGKMLAATREINQLVPEMYKRTIGETVDGVTDVTVKKPTLDELMSLAKNITTQVQVVTEVAKMIPNASGELKNLKPMSKDFSMASKCVKFSKEAIALVGPELEMNLKVTNNLITLLKSSNNY